MFAKYLFRIKGSLPRFSRRWRSFLRIKDINFILVHYLYIIFMTFFGTIILWAGGNFAFVDMLFLSASCTTQGGLNTLDLHRLYLYQQITIYLLSWLCCPMVIHTSVVFVRLYWFEKRFQSVVHDARASRRFSTRMRLELDQEKTIPINVISGAESDSTETYFAVTAVDGNTSLSSHLRNRDEESYAFVEKQRSLKNSSALRIPGPRDFDQGLTVCQVVDQEPSASDNEKRPTVEIKTSREVLTRRFTIINEQRTTIHEDSSSESSPPLPPSPLPPRHIVLYKTWYKSVKRVWKRRENRENQQLPYLSYTATIGRNSAFIDLTEEQRNELGGVEYRSLKTLVWILISYMIGFQLFGMVCLLAWTQGARGKRPDIERWGVSTAWWSVFSSSSFFINLGLTLTPFSMEPFREFKFVMLLGSFLILVGNSAFPCMLRFIVWIVSKFASNKSALWEELQFLLDHPRRCFTLLFPRAATWCLFAIVIFMTSVEIGLFESLEWNNSVINNLSPSNRISAGLFQTASNRTAGFNIVDLGKLHAATLVSYLVMMYISVFPIAISIRGTNVYEERSLGIYTTVSQESDSGQKTVCTGSKRYLGAHLRRQLSFDLWYVFFGLFLVCLFDGKRIGENSLENKFSIFQILFEIGSAYCTVGLSLSPVGVTTSFSGVLSKASKLVVIAMLIRGRHRGLPYALDRAILLPRETKSRKEANGRTANSTIGNVSETVCTPDSPPMGPDCDGIPDTSSQNFPDQRTSLYTNGDGERDNRCVRSRNYPDSTPPHCNSACLASNASGPNTSSCQFVSKVLVSALSTTPLLPLADRRSNGPP